MKKSMYKLSLRKTMISKLDVKTASQIRGGEDYTVNCTSRGCVPAYACKTTV